MCRDRYARWALEETRSGQETCAACFKAERVAEVHRFEPRESAFARASSPQLAVPGRQALRRSRRPSPWLRPITIILKRLTGIACYPVPDALFREANRDTVFPQCLPSKKSARITFGEVLPIHTSRFQLQSRAKVGCLAVSSHF